MFISKNHQFHGEHFGERERERERGGGGGGADMEKQALSGKWRSMKYVPRENRK